MRFGNKGVTAELGVQFFPAALGSDGMSESRSNVLLSGQSGLAKGDGDNFEKSLIVQGNPKENFMSAEEHTKAITLLKPERRIDKGVLDRMTSGVVGIGVER
jgi:hypothetical protein